MSRFAWTDGAVREALGLRTELADDGIAYSSNWTDGIVAVDVGGGDLL